MSEITDFFKKSGESASPPNMDSHKVDKFSELSHIRVAGKFGLQRMYDYLAKDFDKVIVSLETSKGGVQHVHCIINAPIYDRDKKSKQFREQLTTEFNLKGNGSYSISKVRDGDHCISYVLKEGEFLQKGFDQSFIEKRKKVSYLKYSKEAIASDLDEINKKFVGGDINDAEWTRAYIKCKHSYNQYNVNYSRTKELLTNLKMKKDSSYIDNWVDMLLHDV